MSKGLAAPVIAGLVVGIAFVIVFDIFHNNIVSISQKKESSTAANITTTYSGHNLTFAYASLYAVSIADWYVSDIEKNKLPNEETAIDRAAKFDNHNTLSILELDTLPPLKHLLDKAYQNKDAQPEFSSNPLFMLSKSDVDTFFHIIQATNGKIHRDSLEEGKDYPDGREIVSEKFSLVAKYNEAYFIVTLIVTSNIK